jgi:hypothetical protein
MLVEAGPVVGHLDPKEGVGVEDEPEGDGVAIARPPVADGVRHDFADQELEVLRRLGGQIRGVLEDCRAGVPDGSRSSPELDDALHGLPFAG